MGNLGYGIDPEVVQEIAAEVAEVVNGVQVAIVVGGNIFAVSRHRQLGWIGQPLITSV